MVFPQLSQEEIEQIVDLFVQRLAKRLEERNMTIELTPAARTVLAARGYDPAMGARPLRRTIQREIEDQLSERILFGQILAGQHIHVDVEGEPGAEKFTFRAEGGNGQLEGEPAPAAIEG